MIIYEKHNYIKVVYHPDKNYIVFDWTDFLVTLDEIRELHEKALNVALLKKCYFYIAETSKVRSVLRQEVIRWFGDVWVPKLVAAKIKAIVTVVPTSSLAKLSTRSWQAVVLDGIMMKNVKNVAEAEAAIRELQADSR